VKRGGKTMSIRINEFLIFEHTTSDKSTGFGTVVLAIIENKEGEDCIGGSHASVITGVVGGINAECDNSIILVFKKCFDEYKR
jgi:hypothetical protein